MKKFLKNELDFLLFFATYYYVMLNNDKPWETQKKLKL